MRRQEWWAGALALVFVVTAGVPGAHTQTTSVDPRMTAFDRQKLVDYVDRSERELVALAEALTEQQWRWTPAPGRWSVAEILSHLVVAEDYLFEQAQVAMRSPADPDWEVKTSGKTALLERALPDRSRRVQAPEPLAPVTASMGRDEALRRFRSARARTRSFAVSTNAPLRQHLTKGLFPIFDPLNAYQFLLYIPLHTIRHAKQLAEVTADPGFPRSPH